MSVHKEAYQKILTECKDRATLVAVSKTRPAPDVLEFYNLGHLDFGENYVQELVEKYEQLPKDIKWHFIGHLQTNKVKYIAPFIHLIHGVDSLKLLTEINKEAKKNNRIINCLLQVHIAQEETKFGFDEKELFNTVNHYISNKEQFSNVSVIGLMGMASFTENENQARKEFRFLKNLFDKLTLQLSTVNCHLSTLSMGMSSDYKTALEEGSNMIRVGSLLFGAR